MNAQNVDSGIDRNEYQKIFDMCNKISTCKSSDYGTSNLLKHGAFGIMVRMSDKMARLENLISGHASKVDESIDDTCMDLINYAAYLILIRKGFIK